MATDRLNVIGLISGGKDSFFSLAHCIEHGHRVVALANLFPAVDDGTLPIETQWIDPNVPPAQGLHDPAEENRGDETDLNSFMYQTVGHEVIPLYAAATGLPLYRRQIHGGAVHHERDYDYATVASESAENGEETESMMPLLQSIMRQHPEANAVCAGAILSTYQRTRVESVALRLGLTPLAYLWKYPILPSPVGQADDTQLLRDMAAVGLDARIIKVASAGLDESHLWLRASSHEGAERVKRALRKFGAAQGAALGEGGEFETLVLAGPRTLFKKRVHVAEEARSIVQEGGGTSWVRIKGARLEELEGENGEVDAEVRQPSLLDPRFERIFESTTNSSAWSDTFAAPRSTDSPSPALSSTLKEVEYFTTVAFEPLEAVQNSSIQAQTLSIVEQASQYLRARDLEASQVSNTLVLLRDMSDFPAVNAEYSKLFTRANPPSRVTISCGSALAGNAHITISLTVPRSAVGRQGLHVQSRSYWAPANIGPYSQGISLPLSLGDELSSVRCISIAGQIPLLPATMLLPEPSKISTALQLTLSLQHLWRIAVDMKVQWWSSAVVYISRMQAEADKSRAARMAAYAWREANRPPTEDEDEEAQMDPWDLKHNSQHMVLGKADDQSPEPMPNWDLLPLRQQNDWESRLPPIFAAEVESLPRQAEVEWHAHVGISGASDGAIEMFHFEELAQGTCGAWNMLVREKDTVFLHTTLSYRGSSPNASQGTGEAFLEQLEVAYRENLQTLGIDDSAKCSGSPYLLYTHNGRLDVTDMGALDGLKDMLVVHCHSLWAGDGTERDAVALYRHVLTRD